MKTLFILVGVLFLTAVSAIAAAQSVTHWASCDKITIKDPLHSAIMKQDIPTVKCLLKGGYDPNQSTITGLLPLPLSIGSHVEITKSLLQYGAAIEPKNEYALGESLHQLGSIVRYKNLGAQARPYKPTLPYPAASTTDARIDQALKTLGLVLKAGANPNFAPEHDNPQREHTLLFLFSLDICEKPEDQKKLTTDYRSFFKAIKGDSKYDLKLNKADINALNSFFPAPNIPFDKICLNSAREFFSSGV
jgi:ankyrin repeat protein